MREALAIGGLSPGELLIIVAVVVLLFGSQKIPQLMRSMGSGLKEFKKGLAEGAKDDVEPPAGKPPKPAGPGDAGSSS